MKVKPEGNYAFIKGDKGDPNATFLFQGMMEVLKAKPRLRQDQERLRDLHRRLEAGQCPEEHGAVPDLDQQQGRRGAFRERRHGLGRRRRARRAGPGRHRSGRPARTATWPRSTASLSAPSWCRSGRTPTTSARWPAKPPIALADGTRSATIAGVGKFSRRQEGRRDERDPARSRPRSPRTTSMSRSTPATSPRNRPAPAWPLVRCRPATDRVVSCDLSVTQSWPRRLDRWRGLAAGGRPAVRHASVARLAVRATAIDAVTAVGFQRTASRAATWRCKCNRRQVRPSASEGRVTRFFRATEIDTRMLGMVAALLVIWVGFDIVSGILRPGDSAACSAARS